MSQTAVLYPIPIPEDHGSVKEADFRSLLSGNNSGRASPHWRSTGKASRGLMDRANRYITTIIIECTADGILREGFSACTLARMLAADLVC